MLRDGGSQNVLALLSGTSDLGVPLGSGSFLWGPSLGSLEYSWLLSGTPKSDVPLGSGGWFCQQGSKFRYVVRCELSSAII